MAEERDRGLPLIELAVVAEGRMEVAFVKEVLLNHLPEVWGRSGYSD